MKKHLILTLLIILISAFMAFSQEKKDEPDKKDGSPKKVYKANPEDVKSIDAIIKATYDVISGDVGVKRNWDRFRSLFHPSARLTPTGKNPQTGEFAASPLTPQDYVDRSGNFLVANGFTEKEIGRSIDRFGNIAQVFSSYEGTFTQNGKPAKIRGINSFQLMNDGKRWWVMSIFWQAEGKDNPIPEKYLKSID